MNYIHMNILPQFPDKIWRCPELELMAPLAKEQQLKNSTETTKMIDIVL